jgi:hypothetical protein
VDPDGHCGFEPGDLPVRLWRISGFNREPFPNGIA